MTSFDPSSLLQFAGYAFFIVFMLFGQKLQLMQMLAKIGTEMKKLATLRDKSFVNLRAHITKFVPSGMSKEQEVRLHNMITSIAIPPVSNLDPAGLVPKMKNTFKTYDRFLKSNLKRIVGDVSQSDLENLTNSLEVAVELDIIHRVIDHFFRLAKKGGIMGAYMILMALPELMKMADALNAASAHFQTGLPIGDTFGPMVAAKFQGTEAEDVSDSETTVKVAEFEGRKIITVKARGPGGSVGNPDIAVQKIMTQTEPSLIEPSLIVTIDAALKMESENTGDVAEGVGVAMGGSGAERFGIEEATVNIPVLTVVCKMSMKEAISAMPKVVLDQVGPVFEKVLTLIRENSESGQTVIVVGVGNTMGCI
jgi:hypothetical protein